MYAYIYTLHSQTAYAFFVNLYSRTCHHVRTMCAIQNLAYSVESKFVLCFEGKLFSFVHMLMVNNRLFSSVFIVCLCIDKTFCYAKSPVLGIAVLIQNLQRLVEAKPYQSTPQCSSQGRPLYVLLTHRL